jgi:glycosidase
VRANDADFLMLDETLPNDPVYSQSQFGAHFDTHGFTYAAHDIAQLDPEARGDPEALLDAVKARREQGHPEYSRILNAVENHDEHRLLNQAAIDVTDPDRETVTEAEWDRAAERQRAAFAASVTLPGVPMIYYGQEREISRYGVGRHGGEDDDRGVRDGEVFLWSDVRPGGRQRAFVNWESYDEDHLAFYRTLIDAYHDLDALEPAAALEQIDTDDTVEAVAFLRDASSQADVEGPERLLVVLNFEADPVSVAVPPGVETTDLLTGAESAGENGAVRVDTVGVFAVDGALSDEQIELDAGGR